MPGTNCREGSEGERDLLIKLGIFLTATLSFVLISSCSTTKVEPLPPPPPAPPAYVEVQHPEGLDLGDLMAIFTRRDALSLDSQKNCDSDFLKLHEKTQSRDELAEGTRELVRLDAVKYHWCFYGKLLLLEEQLKADTFIDERQKHVLETYSFLTPLARAFSDEYQDTRYLRWAIYRYKRLSEYVFYRKLDLSPGAYQTIGAAPNPYESWRQSHEPTRAGILERYGVLAPAPLSDTPGAPLAPVEPIDRAPASSVPTLGLDTLN